MGYSSFRYYAPTLQVDPLKELCEEIPKWQAKLGQLEQDMDNRQLELAAAWCREKNSPNHRSGTADGADIRSPARSLRSLRNKGSCESLKPKDDPGACITDPIDSEPSPTTVIPVQEVHDKKDNAIASPPMMVRSSTSPGPIRSASMRKAGAAALAAMNENGPLASMARKRKTESLASGLSDVEPKKMTRRQIKIFYDGWIQSTFEQLQKDIAIPRNSLRKANAAGKKSKLTSFASSASAMPTGADDMLAPDDDFDLLPEPAKKIGVLPDTLDADVDDASPSPAAQIISQYAMGRRNLGLAARLGTAGAAPAATRRSANPNFVNGKRVMSRGNAMYRSALEDDGSEIYDELDGGLEWAAAMCAHAAHQFLRDGTCRPEVHAMKKRLQELMDRAAEHKELPEYKALMAKSGASTPIRKKASMDPDAMMADIGDLEAEASPPASPVLAAATKIDMNPDLMMTPMGDLEVDSDDSLGDLTPDSELKAQRPVLLGQTKGMVPSSLALFDGPKADFPQADTGSARREQAYAVRGGAGTVGGGSGVGHTGEGGVEGADAAAGQEACRPAAEQRARTLKGIQIRKEKDGLNGLAMKYAVNVNEKAESGRDSDDDKQTSKVEVMGLSGDDVEMGDQGEGIEEEEQLRSQYASVIARNKGYRCQ